MRITPKLNNIEKRLFYHFRIPAPELPPTNRYGDVAVSALSIAVVTYAINISMAKIFAKKHNYEIDANQVCFNQFSLK